MWISHLTKYSGTERTVRQKQLQLDASQGRQTKSNSSTSVECVVQFLRKTPRRQKCRLNVIAGITGHAWHNSGAR